jgi:hypothetical protein
MPSSVAEVDSGGDGVGDRNEEAPLLEEAVDGKSMKRGREAAEAELANCGEKRPAGEWGLHESFMRSMAAEHSDRTSSSSWTFSLVRRLRELR